MDPRALNLRHLHAMAAIMRTGSISAAAKAVNLTQPAITQAIAKLESLIGQNYVVRSGKQLTTKAAFLKGKLQVNGHDVPLPMLPGAGAQEEEPQEPLPQ